MNQDSISPLGDTLATVVLGNGISEELSRLVVAKSESIARAGIIGVSDIVPGYAAIGVHYDPVVIAFDDLRDRLLAVLDEESPGLGSDFTAQLHTIPVRYDGDDLREVAARTGLTTDVVIGLHSSIEYRVFVIGFVPGFAYLGQLDERLALPRRASPRPRVPSGAVAIADRQTAIYPSATPGGWHLIGSSQVKLFDSSSDSPSLFRVGDRVRFIPA